MKKLFPLFIIVVLMLMVSSVFADDLSDVKQAGVLRFGAPLEFVPFVFEDDSGNSTGIDIALMEEVCKRMGVRLQKTSFARDGILDALDLRQIDVIGGGLSKTDSPAHITTAKHRSLLLHPCPNRRLSIWTVSAG